MLAHNLHLYIFLDKVVVQIFCSWFNWMFSGDLYQICLSKIYLFYWSLIYVYRLFMLFPHSHLRVCWIWSNFTTLIPYINNTCLLFSWSFLIDFSFYWSFLITCIFVLLMLFFFWNLFQLLLVYLYQSLYSAYFEYKLILFF